MHDWHARARQGELAAVEAPGVPIRWHVGKMRDDGDSDQRTIDTRQADAGRSAKSGEGDAAWAAGPRQRDPIEILEGSSQGR